jgi:hypothetical protein
MLKKLKLLFCNQNERGIALLFSLTFLALLMVLALAFASNSMLEQKIAYYGKSSISSKMLADSALNRIVTLMQFYDSGVFYSRDSTSTATLTATTNPYDLADDLETMEGSSYVFQWVDTGTGITGYENKIMWDFIRQDQVQDDGTTANKIIGRVAYVIIPDGEVSPLALVKGGVNEAVFSEHRVGQQVNEINVRSIDTATITIDNANGMNLTGTGGGKQPATGWIEFPTMFGTGGLNITSAQKKVDFRKWFLLDANEDREAYWLDTTRDNVIEQTDPSNDKFEQYQRFNLMGFTDSNGNGEYDSGVTVEANTNIWEFIGNDATRMRNLLLLDFVNTVGLRENGQPRERPPKWVDEDDLTTADGSTTHASISAAYSDIDSSDPDDPADYRVPGLLWLANFGTTSANGNSSDPLILATFPNATARRLQIAANLVDYSDSDSIPTSDSSNWSSAAPSYTGNEKTPYINEVYFRYSFLPTLVKSGGDRTLTIGFDVDYGGEVIDIYNCSSAAATLTLMSVQVQIAYSIDGVSQTAYDSTLLTPGTVSTVNTWTTNGYGSANLVNVFSDSITIYGPGAQNGLPEDVTIDNVKIVSATVMLTVAGNNADFVKLNTDNAQSSGMLFGSIAWNSIKSTDTIPSATIYTFQTFEANDPRQNLNNADWRSAYVDYSLFTAGKNTGVVEDISTASTDRDQESLGTSANTIFPAYDYSGGNKTVSTAYIRNRPMISPWELGFIHRGAKWQTINLKEYYDTYAVSASETVHGDVALNIGGGTYANGDANIMDQIKMTNEATSSKKINLKTHREGVLNALMGNLVYGSLPTQLVSGGTLTGVSFDPTAGTPTAIDVIIDKAIDYTTRANLAEIPNFTSASVSDDDATKEEIFGKIINLTTASGKTQYFTVIIIGQAVRDIGGNGSTVSITKTDVNGVSNSANCQLGTFDYLASGTNAASETHEEIFFDEILATTKLKVRLYRSDTGEVKVLSYQYVN